MTMNGLWPARRAHLVVTKAIDLDRADDLLQSFVSQKFLEANLAARAVQARGRFRTFVLTALDRFIISEYRRVSAKKRAPASAPSGDPEWVAAQGPEGAPPSDSFDIAWARQVLSESIRRVAAECRAAGRSQIWGVFECRILGPTLEGRQPKWLHRLLLSTTAPSRSGCGSPTWTAEPDMPPSQVEFGFLHLYRRGTIGSIM